MLLKKIFVHRNFNMKSTSAYDSSWSLNYSKKKFATSAVGNLKYGSNIKDKKTKDIVEFSLTAKHKEQGDDTIVNYTTTLKLPAKVKYGRQLYYQFLPLT